MDVNYSPRGPQLRRPTHHSASPRYRHGLTLIELIIALAIMAIILTLAAPSFAALLQDTRLTTTVNSLVSTLQHARSEAIKRGISIVVCKGQPDVGCSNRRSWSEGWFSFVDSDGDRDWSENEAQLWSQPALSEGTQLNFAAFPSANHVFYYPEGSASSNGTFVFCDTRGSNHAKALILANSGRLRISDKTSTGAPLSCL